MEIQLVPGSLHHPNIVNRLNQTIAKAEAIRGCVAFWLIKTKVFGDHFSSLIGRENSFYCIDINKPTDLDAIDEHYKAGARNIFMHLYRTGKSIELFPNLLHAKIMLFDLPGDTAEIWIGSHNLTMKALTGRNKEASTVVNCGKDSDFYKDVNLYLQDIKNICDPYDTSLLDYYKSLQNWGQETDSLGEVVTTIKLIGNNIENITNNTILLLGDHEPDLLSLGLGKVNNPIYVNVLDLQGRQQELIFKARVESSGRIDLTNPASYRLQFSNRPYAIRQHPYLPYQGWRSKEFGFDELKPFTYWTNIVIEEPLTKARLEPVRKRREKLWYRIQEADYIRNFKRDNFPLLTESENTLLGFEENDEKIIIYKAQPFGLGEYLLNFNNLENKYSLQSALKRSKREKVLNFFQRNFEQRYFNSESNNSDSYLPLPGPGTDEFKILKEFQSNSLGTRMRLIND